MVLAFASFLVEHENWVGIVTSEFASRKADLSMQVALDERVDIEVKTPLALRGPLKSELTESDAARRVTKVLKDAAATKGGQLNTDSAWSPSEPTT